MPIDRDDRRPQGRVPYPPPLRPRQPGVAPATTLDRLREEPDLQIRTAAVAAGLILVAVIVTIALVIGGDDDTTSTPQPAPAADAATATEPLTLPLDLTDVGFGDGTIEQTPLDEGPAALGYCNNTPPSEGLVEWTGNRLTEQDGHRRVAQLVARFRSSLDAVEYLEASGAAVDCEQWEAAGADGPVTFTATEEVPATMYGDGTVRIDLRANADGPDLFLRTILVRSGREVAQITYVSANRQDLALLEGLVAVAIAELGY